MTKPTLAIYGIKQLSFMHDHNLCLMQNGKILQYLQLERYTREKYDNRLDLFLEELVDSKLLDLPDEFDFVSVNSFVGNAFISKNGKIRFESAQKNTLSEDLDKGRVFFQNQMWEGKEQTAFNCSHELAHVASCLPFFGGFKENSLIVSFDGGSSLGNFAAYVYRNGKIVLLENHWDKLGYLPKFFNDNALNFQILGATRDEHCSVPGKLMGYACFGSYSEDIERWLKENNYFKNHWNRESDIFDSIKSTFGIEIKKFDNTQKFLQDIAATFQHIFEADFVQKIERLQVNTKTEYLYYTGGCALNIVTNTKLIKRQFFKDVFIPPCPNDSGLSIGAASFVEIKKGNNIKMHSPYLCNVGLYDNCNETISDDLIDHTARILLNGGIIGVCNGNAEIGPRALGNRSLLALANSKKLAQKLSMQIKKREWYRPIAPIMLESIAEEVSAEPLHHLSMFMLLEFTIKKEFKKDLEGIIHVNQTARIQTIKDESDNPFIFKLLEYLYNNYNILALINTSFNAQGEPMVHTAKNALESAKVMNLNGVVINNIFHKIGDDSELSEN